MTWGTILMVIGILTFIEALIVLLFPKAVIKMCKSVKALKKIGWWEFIIAIVLFLIGMNI